MRWYTTHTPAVPPYCLTFTVQLNGCCWSMQNGNSHMHIQQDPQHKSVHQNPLWVLTAQLLVFWVRWFNFPAELLSTLPYTLWRTESYQIALTFFPENINMHSQCILQNNLSHNRGNKWAVNNLNFPMHLSEQLLSLKTSSHELEKDKTPQCKHSL